MSMNQKILLLVILVIGIGIVGVGYFATLSMPSPSPSFTPSPTPTITPTPTPTTTPTIPSLPYALDAIKFYPESGATNVSLNTTIAVRITQEVNITLLLTPHVTVSSVSWEGAGILSRRYTFHLTEELEANTTYRATVSYSNNEGWKTSSWRFTTSGEVTPTPTPTTTPTPTSNPTPTPNIGDVPVVETTWIEEMNRLLDEAPFPEPPSQDEQLLMAYNSWLEENGTSRYTGSWSIPLNTYLFDLLGDVNCLVLDGIEQSPKIGYDDKAVSLYVRHSRAPSMNVTFRSLADPVEQETRSFKVGGALFILEHQIDGLAWQIYIEEIHIVGGQGSSHWSGWVIADHWVTPSPTDPPISLLNFPYHFFPKPNATGVSTDNFIISVLLSRPASLVEFQITPSVQVLMVTMEPFGGSSGRFMMGLAEQLQPETLYTVTLTVGQDNHTRTISWSFTTSNESH